MENFVIKVNHSNVGKKWTDEEENILMEELNSFMDIATIANLHGRTTYGIECRLIQIVYKLHMNGNSIEEIMKKTKLHTQEISELISRQEKKINKTTEKKIKPPKYCDCLNLKQEIEELKKDSKEILRLIRTIYEFEIE